jgi:hypothetical protein
MNNIKLNKQVFVKTKFNETVDTSFSQLIEPSNPTFFDINLATVDDFFTLYNRLFFEIPKNGVVNSHEFLVKESSEYIQVERTNEDIQILLDEIADLRRENLSLREEIVGLISNPLNT